MSLGTVIEIIIASTTAASVTASWTDEWIDIMFDDSAIEKSRLSSDEEGWVDEEHDSL